MAPAFRPRKTDNKAPELIVVGTDKPTSEPARSQLDLPTQASKPNRIRLDPSPSSPRQSAESLQPDSTSDDAQPPTHGFLSTVNQYLRKPRLAAKDSKEFLNVSFGRNRSASAPCDPADLRGPKPIEAPVPWPPYLLAASNATRAPMPTIANTADYLEEELQASAWVRHAKPSKMRGATEALQLPTDPMAPKPYGANLQPPAAPRRLHSEGVVQLHHNQDMSHHQPLPQQRSQSQTRQAVTHGPQPPSSLESLTPRRPTDRSSFSEDECLLPVSYPRGMSHQRAVSVPTVSGARHQSPPSNVQDAYGSELGEIKAAHAAHVAYLNEDHAREIASLRTHISLLEKQAILPLGQHLSPSGLLPPLDTGSRPHSRQNSETDSRAASCDSALRFSSASMQSFEATMDLQRQQIEEAVHEADDLRMMLEKRDSDLSEMKRKMGHLQDDMAVKDRAVSQMRGAMLRAAEKENMLKTKLADLQTRLDLAEDERLELLERSGEVKTHVRTLLKQNSALQKQVTEAEERCKTQVDDAKVKVAEAEKSVSASQTKLKIEKDHAKNAETSLGSVKAELAAAQTRIAQLEKQAEPSLDHGLITIVNALDHMSNGNTFSSSSDGSRSSPLKTPELSPGNEKEKILALRSKVKRLEAERDQLSGLLSTEIRRAIRNSPKEKDFVSASYSRRDSTCSTVSSLLHHDQASMMAIPDGVAHKGCRETMAETRGAYEKEIQGMIKEIVLYKLDIKGYKKDLRRANSTLSKAKASPAVQNSDRPDPLRPDPLRPRASTPNLENAKRPTLVHVRGRRSASVDDSSRGVGLGITIDRPALRRDFVSFDTGVIRDVVVRPIAKRKDSGTVVMKKRSSDDEERISRSQSQRGPAPMMLTSLARSESPVPLLQVETAASLRPLSTVAEAGSAVERDQSS